MNSEFKNEKVTGIGAKPTRVASSCMPKIECAGLTDIGRVRENNQDQFLIADLHKDIHVLESSQPGMDEHLYGDTMGKLMFVADGMGGAQAGEVASDMAIQTMAQFLLNSMHWLFNPKPQEIDQFMEDLKSGAMRSHEAVKNNAEQKPNWHGMGTTLTVAYLMWPMLYVLHVGDSRCYILRDKSLQLLTKDQTLAQHLYDHGQLSQQELETSQYNHVLLSAIGAKGKPEAIVYKTRLLRGDRIMLCSDGVNGHLSDDEVEEILSADRSARDICRQFIETANRRGGQDNITTVVAVTS